MAITTKSQIGKYVCNVGYLDIRQRMIYKKPTEVFVVHGRYAIAGPFTSIEHARVEARRCVEENRKHDKYRK